jgi:hypothetical protein
MDVDELYSKLLDLAERLGGFADDEAKDELYRACMMIAEHPQSGQSNGH